VGLAFALLLPVIGLAALAWTAVKALAQFNGVRRALRVAGLAATPFIGLVYVVLLPVAGVCMLLWFGLQAVQARLALR
jgi:hypothetical protein